MRKSKIAFALVVAIFLWWQLSSCKREHESSLAKVEENVPADLPTTGESAENVTKQTDEAKVCEKCGKLGGKYHDCRFTSYCSLCRRDIGDGHICGVTTLCTTCFAEKGDLHECLVTSFCKLCRTDVAANHLYERATRKCFTSYCAGCKADVGEGHICGVTHFCPRCRREVAYNHACDLTLLCPKCNVEYAREVLCERCKQQLGHADAGAVGVELFCSACKTQLELPTYRWGTTIECTTCEAKNVLPAVKCNSCGETRKPILHQCGATHFCTKCKMESPLDGHKH